MKEGKILKEKSREYKGTVYYKYKLNIPQTILTSAGIKAGDTIEFNATKDSITIKRVEKPQN